MHKFLGNENAAQRKFRWGNRAPHNNREGSAKSKPIMKNALTSKKCWKIASVHHVSHALWHIKTRFY